MVGQLGASVIRTKPKREKNVALFADLGALRQDNQVVSSGEEVISGLTSQQYDKKVDVV